MAGIAGHLDRRPAIIKPLLAVTFGQRCAYQSGTSRWDIVRVIESASGNHQNENTEAR
jgi:hypothetical protein